MRDQQVVVAIVDGVAVISLDRPQVRNVLSPGPDGTRGQLLTAFSAAEANPDVAAIVLTSTGADFSAGADLTAATPRLTLAADLEFVAEADAFHRSIRRTAIPVIAAVRGHCLGAGLLLACSADIVVASTTARFGLPEGRLGLIGASPLVPLVGRQWAKFLIMTGEPIDAWRARDIGLALTVVQDEQLDARSLDLGIRLARMPRDGLVLNKAAIDAVADECGEAAGRAESLSRDAATLHQAAGARAPDGRTFRDILQAEGMKGLKAAREAQWSDPWLQGDA
ncbi:MAG TPA: enoyl-CoA hydratase/isomerase family protein [Mycobacteriales bacterium]|nr:enoyl-CoA hydratase/isomerase family protein [Mycobacteriales bacterium]